MDTMVLLGDSTTHCRKILKRVQLDLGPSGIYIRGGATMIDSVDHHRLTSRSHLLAAFTATSVRHLADTAVMDIRAAAKVWLYPAKAW